MSSFRMMYLLLSGVVWSGSGRIHIILADPDPNRDRHPGHADPDPDLYPFQQNVKLNYNLSRKFQFTVHNIEKYTYDKMTDKMQPGMWIGQQKNWSNFPKCVKLKVGSGSASKWKIRAESGSALKWCRSTTMLLSPPTNPSATNNNFKRKKFFFFGQFTAR